MPRLGGLGGAHTRADTAKVTAEMAGNSSLSSYCARYSTALGALVSGAGGRCGCVQDTPTALVVPSPSLRCTPSSIFALHPSRVTFVIRQIEVNLSTLA